MNADVASVVTGVTTSEITNVISWFPEKVMSKTPVTTNFYPMEEQFPWVLMPTPAS